jgi:hypothetical protein
MLRLQSCRLNHVGIGQLQGPELQNMDINESVLLLLLFWKQTPSR